MRIIDAPLNLGFRNDNRYNSSSSQSTLKTLTKTFPSIGSMSDFHFEKARLSDVSVNTPVFVGKSCIDSDLGRGKFNKCTHSSFRGVCLGFGTWTKNAVPLSSYYYYSGFRKVGMTGSPIIKPKHLDESSGQAASRAWWTMQPRFEGLISLINFLYELKDVRELLGMAHSAFKGLKGLRRTYSKLLSNPKFDPSKPLAGVYLATEFGIKPLIKDLITIIGQLGTIVQEAQVKFQAMGQGDGLTHHYTETLAEISNFTLGTGNSFFMGYGGRSKTDFNATLRFKYDYKMRDDFSAFMKYWGLSGSIEALWEATPFSFIVDYFIKVGKAIHAMEVDPNIKVFAMDYCESLKTTITNGTHLVSDTRNIAMFINGSQRSDGLVSGYEGKLYYRYPTTPNRGMFIPQLSSGLSGKQATNLAAVLRTLL